MANIDGTAGNDRLDGTGRADFIQGFAGDDTLTSGGGNDTIIGGPGEDQIDLGGGNNTIWAGAGDADYDWVRVFGNGHNTIGLGGGGDDAFIDGAGDNTVFGGAGRDIFRLTSAADGDNVIWSGTEGDTIWVLDGADGDNTLGGGLGADSFEINGDGNNTIYLGADDGELVPESVSIEDGVVTESDTSIRIDDSVVIEGDGNNTIFGGAGPQGLGTNRITIWGNGDNEVFNGNGDDVVRLNYGGEGDNLLWGGAGDDRFAFLDADANGTLKFTSGNGHDTVTGFTDNDASSSGDLRDGQILDVSDLDFASAQDVLNNMRQVGDDVVLRVSSAQSVTFEDAALAEFQNADASGWLIV